MLTDSSDMEWISLTLKGDTNAYANLISRYQNMVFTLCLRILKTREDAEEVAQDVFVKAYRSLADFKGDSKFSTWIYTIAHHSCLSFLRKNKLQVQSLDVEPVFHQADSRAGYFSADSIELKSKIKLVSEAIQLLSTEDAQVITLFYKSEQSLEEIGHILGIEANTVKVRLHRARTRLREKMEKHYSRELNELKS